MIREAAGEQILQMRRREGFQECRRVGTSKEISRSCKDKMEGERSQADTEEQTGERS